MQCKAGIVGVSSGVTSRNFPFECRENFPALAGATSVAHCVSDAPSEIRYIPPPNYANVRLVYSKMKYKHP